MGKKKSKRGDLLKPITLLLFLLMLFLIIPIVTIDERQTRSLFILTEVIICIFFIVFCIVLLIERDKRIKSKRKKKKSRQEHAVVNEEPVQSLAMPTNNIKQPTPETASPVENKDEGPRLVQSIVMLIGTILGAIIAIINIANKMQGGFGHGSNSSSTSMNSGYYVCMKCKAIQNVQGGYRGHRQCGCGGNMIWKN